MKNLLLSNFLLRKKRLYQTGSILLVLLLSYFILKPSGEILSETDFSQVVYTRDKKVLSMTLSIDD
jgi:hypothetical protein